MKDVETKYLAIGPLDGRYHEIGEALAPYFSEFALMRYRVRVEVEWLIFLLDELAEEDLPPEVSALSEDQCNSLRSIYRDFDGEKMQRIKKLESKTNHDVKAVELFIDDWLERHDLSVLKPLVHIGCTSEDINNLAYALMTDDAMSKVWGETAGKLLDKLDSLAREWAEIPMLAHTHGQPASTTTLGKELRVMHTRLSDEFFVETPIRGKFNGATGTYAAISLAYPNYDWIARSRQFVEGFGLEFSPCTTQIESHDWLARLLDNVRRFNNIMRNIDQDMWFYISMEYLAQQPKSGEVGSSTMPHKVNPIRFENSEANCEVSNALCQVLADQLMNSRMQRDLSDSSLLRNLGLAIGYSVQAIQNCLAGLERIAPGRVKMSADLEMHWEVLAEAIQTVLRKHGIPDAYDRLKEATRGKEILEEDIGVIINELMEQIPDDGTLYTDLMAIFSMSPKDYVGYAQGLASWTQSV